MVTKAQMVEAIQSLPDDATVDDAVERLHFIEWLEERVADADARPNDWLTQDEVERRVGLWQQ